MTDESKPLAFRLNNSPTAALEAKVEELAADGVTVYRLGLGEPDFNTPDHVKDAGIQAIKDDFSRYTATGGMQALRKAAADRLAVETGVTYQASETIVTAGAKQALFNALAALCPPGGEVLLPVPHWVSFPEQIRAVGGVPVQVRATAAQRWRVTVEDLAAKVTPRTKGLIFNSPNNPSGAVYTRAEQQAIARLCVEKDLWVISDEIYSQYVFTEEGHASIASFPGMRERTVVVNAVSKTYGMTGWRIGYAAAPAPLIKAMVTLQSHVTSNASSIAQKAAVAALSGSHAWFDPIREHYKVRRDSMVTSVNASKGMTCVSPDGTFFVWADMSEWIGKQLAGRAIKSSEEFAAVLLEDARVAVMPGTGFGDDRMLRLAFANGDAELAEGLRRIKAITSGGKVAA
ncbi:MAG: pyridoxal phosphate-dependent aminotransferase [Chloroflexi bacterium]|nr:pyridoxal phosphate-dependent aminotransferase [Chloroflexota bacterium]